MSKRKMQRRRNQNASSIKMVLGVGLILIGIASFLVLKSGNAQSGPTASRSVTPAEVNYSAPELALTNLDGQAESLADYRDRVVLVNNWATWCPPCKAEIPTLDAYYQAHAAKGFVIIGIDAGETQEEVKTFVQSSSMSYPVWIDPQNKALEAFNNQSLPSSFVIDRSGTVRLAWVGEIDRETLEKYVTPLLVEN